MARRRPSGNGHGRGVALVAAAFIVGIVAVALWAVGSTGARAPSIGATATATSGMAAATLPGAAGAHPATASPSATALRAIASKPPAARPSAQVPVSSPQLFPGGLLIADRDNRRLLVVDDGGNILWRFPVAGSLSAGQTFSADDAFVAADGRTIVSNEESNNVIVRIDIATQKIVWQYGTFDVHGSAPGQLWTPDDAYPLPNGDIAVADIKNCRILEITPDQQIVRQWGTTGLCHDNPPASFGAPNGDTPLPDGGLLVTEIDGSRVVRLSASGSVVFNIAVPAVYPSDAQLMPNGDVMVADYANPGAVLIVDPATGRLVYRYSEASGLGRLDHPSLAVPLPNGSFVVTDDERARVVVIDPQTNAITWSYGVVDHAGSADGSLNLPDGVNVVPAGIFQ